MSCDDSVRELPFAGPGNQRGVAAASGLFCDPFAPPIRTAFDVREQDGGSFHRCPCSDDSARLQLADPVAFFFARAWPHGSIGKYWLRTFSVLPSLSGRRTDY
tara:strand:- start:511 stop:819 length:309 start_codon:yes stop_codon:yes gene_type:complete